MDNDDQVQPQHPQLRILVVDDEQAVRVALARALQKRGHEVHTAADAYDGLRLARELAFDVALVDAHMPGSGIRLIAWLAELPAPGDRVVLMSGDLDPADLETIHPAHVLMKPFEIGEMIQVLERVAAGTLRARPAAPRPAPVSTGPVGVSRTESWRRVSERALIGFCHELNGRISALIGLRGILAPPAEGDAEVMQMMEAELTRLEASVRQLRALAGELSDRPAPLELPALLDSVLPLLRRQAGMEQVEVELHTAASVPPVVAPRSELSRALLVLLTLAAEHSSAGGSGFVRLRLEEDGGDAVIAVEARSAGPPRPATSGKPPFLREQDAVAGVRATLAAVAGELRIQGGGPEGGTLARYELRLPGISA